MFPTSIREWICHCQVVVRRMASREAKTGSEAARSVQASIVNSSESMSDLETVARDYLTEAVIDELGLDRMSPAVIAWHSDQAEELASWLRDTIANFMVTGIASPPEQLD